MPTPRTGFGLEPGPGAVTLADPEKPAGGTRKSFPKFTPSSP